MPSIYCDQSIATTIVKFCSTSRVFTCSPPLTPPECRSSHKGWDLELCRAASFAQKSPTRVYGTIHCNQARHAGSSSSSSVRQVIHYKSQCPVLTARNYSSRARMCDCNLLAHSFHWILHHQPLFRLSPFVKAFGHDLWHYPPLSFGLPPPVNASTAEFY